MGTSAPIHHPSWFLWSLMCLGFMGSHFTHSCYCLNQCCSNSGPGISGHWWLNPWGRWGYLCSLWNENRYLVQPRNHREGWCLKAGRRWSPWCCLGAQQRRRKHVVCKLLHGDWVNSWTGRLGRCWPLPGHAELGSGCEVTLVAGRVREVESEVWRCRL